MRTPLILALALCLLAGCEKPASSGPSPSAPPPATQPAPAPPAGSSPAASTPAAPAANNQLIKVIVKRDDTILADGRPTTIDALEGRLQAVAGAGGECWYYREDMSGTQPIAERVLQLAQKHNCRIWVSTKPDFSNYIDAEGEVHPRQ